MELRSGRRLSSLPPRKRNKSLNRRSNRITESTPSNIDIGRDEDRISTLSDYLLLGILERVDLPSAVRAGAVSTRWQHLPHQLSHLHLDVGHFPGATPLETMDAFTGAMRRLLSTCSPAADCNSSRAIKTLILSFYMSSTHLCSIGRTVEDVVTHSATERLEFNISLPSANKTRFGKQFMSFSRSCRVTFRCLTRLTLKNLAFGHSDVTNLINACDRLDHLTLSCCRLVKHSALKIDTPCSGIKELKFICFMCTWIELISVPKLRQVRCVCWPFENPPVRFGYVLELRDIWIQPEHPKNLAAIFRNLATVFLLVISTFMCQNTREQCRKDQRGLGAIQGFEAPNLKVLLIFGCEDEDRVTNYIRLVMERAKGLKRIDLRGEYPCEDCNTIDLERSNVEKDGRRRIKEGLTHGSSSSVEIIIC
uniref:F-box domain-containing protein n=1 Tax=Aegilops tauschii TaxID=37682 RepID=M8BUR4_AEGTA